MIKVDGSPEPTVINNWFEGGEKAANSELPSCDPHPTERSTTSGAPVIE